jgi:hypothetical protein
MTRRWNLSRGSKHYASLIKPLRSSNRFAHQTASLIKPLRSTNHIKQTIHNVADDKVNEENCDQIDQMTAHAMLLIIMHHQPFFNVFMYHKYNNKY